MPIIFVLIDGVGLAPAGPSNPVAAGFVRLRQTLGAPLSAGLRVERSGLYAASIDATLGLPGLPQSGSGHAAIYGGYNAAQAQGRHQPSFPSVAMRAHLQRWNLLLAARQQGARVAWANAYLPGYADAIAQRRLRHTAGTWSALAAGLPLAGIAEVLAGTALTWDIDRRLARRRPDGAALPLLEPHAAGAVLARLARRHDLVAFETYLPDLAAHGRLPLTVAEVLTTVDALLAGVIAALPADTTLVVTSDHGNSEDATTRSHTRNPVPLLALGPAAALFRDVQAIDQLAAALLAALQGGSSPHSTTRLEEPCRC
ncbi:alkaline phosphatase family protein [Kallotenue papyrolyticum]|uniref:alkaline phosphatase family protein n=1 Tax=Kallotenue papyrolyticum TaxID=1325125 RepID=UPI000492E588|nr:alkaline phosphatase family protein [Kallotenue papyrolyticum]